MFQLILAIYILEQQLRLFSRLDLFVSNIWFFSVAKLIKFMASHRKRSHY